MRDNGVDLRGNFPGTLRVPLVPATKLEIIYPDERYPTLQHAVDALLAGGRLILREGEYERGVTIAKELELMSQAGAEVTLRARSKKVPMLSLMGWARLSVMGLKVTGGEYGFLLGADAQATITESDISGNRDGIYLGGSAKANIEGNEILSNGGYGIALEERPCFDTDSVFTGYVTGKKNTIPGPGEPNGNRKGSVCPPELSFLMTEEGGELDRRK